MNKMWIVLRYDIINRVTKASFWIGGFVIPLLALLVITGIGYVRDRALLEPGSTPEPPVTTPKTIGYVDEAQLLRQLPDGVDLSTVRAYADESAARAALEAGEIGVYYVIPADYLTTGKLMAYVKEFRPLDSDQTFPDPILKALLKFNLLDGDETRLALLEAPMRLKVETTAPPSAYDEDNPLTFYIPYSVTMLFYAFIMMSASLLLNALNIEKQNRVLETLLLSLRPLDLLIGKMLSLAVLALLQLITWAGSGLLLLRLGGKTLNIPPGMTLPASLLTWGIAFFLLGYLIYASLMAGIGALVTDLREASQVTLLVLSPLIVPLFFINLLIEDPHGLFSTVLSIFPFTAPVVMMTRLSVGHVPLWHPLLALGGLAVTALLIVRATTNLFRAQILLTGQPLTIKRYLLALFGRGL